MGFSGFGMSFFFSLQNLKHIKWNFSVASQFFLFILFFCPSRKESPHVWPGCHLRTDPADSHRKESASPGWAASVGWELAGDHKSFYQISGIPCINIFELYRTVSCVWPVCIPYTRMRVYLTAVCVCMYAAQKKGSRRLSRKWRPAPGPVETYRPVPAPGKVLPPPSLCF